LEWFFPYREFATRIVHQLSGGGFESGRLLSVVVGATSFAEYHMLPPIDEPIELFRKN
jgi:hypothetical protein